MKTSFKDAIEYMEQVRASLELFYNQTPIQSLKIIDDWWERMKEKKQLVFTCI